MRLTLLRVVALVAVLTTFAGCTFTQTIAHPRNVFEEIWNLVLTEQHTTDDTVLTTATEDAVVDYDFGTEFVGIHIPACHVTIGWETEGETLSFLFPTGAGNYVRFIYDRDENVLYGSAGTSFLVEHFLKDYFEWSGEATAFSADDPGEFSYDRLNNRPR